MINGLGIVGWGVGGIEAEAGMLGQPVYFLTPDVVGVHLTGRTARGGDGDGFGADGHAGFAQGEGAWGNSWNSTGLALAALPVVDRATIANMAPEYGATMGFFPIDGECVNYLRATGRTAELLHALATELLPRAAGCLRHSETRRDRVFDWTSNWI